jgi:hypothetical protein
MKTHLLLDVQDLQVPGNAGEGLGRLQSPNYDVFTHNISIFMNKKSTTQKTHQKLQECTFSNAISSKIGFNNVENINSIDLDEILPANEAIPAASSLQERSITHS